MSEEEVLNLGRNINTNRSRGDNRKQPLETSGKCWCVLDLQKLGVLHIWDVLRELSVDACYTLLKHMSTATLQTDPVHLVAIHCKAGSCSCLLTVETVLFPIHAHVATQGSGL